MTRGNRSTHRRSRGRLHFGTPTAHSVHAADLEVVGPRRTTTHSVHLDGDLMASSGQFFGSRSHADGGPHELLAITQFERSVSISRGDVSAPAPTPRLGTRPQHVRLGDQRQHRVDNPEATDRPAGTPCASDRSRVWEHHRTTATPPTPHGCTPRSLSTCTTSGRPDQPPRATNDAKCAHTRSR